MQGTAVLTTVIALTACADQGGDRLTGAVQSYIDAMGGREALEGIRSVHTVDSITMAGLSGCSEAWWVRDPFMGRVRIALGPVEQHMIFQGDSAWSLDRNGNLAPAGLEGLTQLESARATVFNTAFLECSGLEYAGDTLIAGQRAVLIRLDLDSPVTYCLSANTGLPVALVTTAMGMTVVQYPGDYTEIDGVTVPLTTVDSLPGMGMETVSRNILTEFNTSESFDDSLFSPIRGAPDRQLTTSDTPSPFRLHQGHIYLEALVNGREALAILDSGAGATLLDSIFACELGLIPEGEFQAQGISGSQEFAFVPVDSYEVAGAVLRGQLPAVLPIREAFLPATGMSIDMIVGYDFLCRFVTEIDYPGRTITLHRRGEYNAPPGALRVPGRLSMSLISFDALIEDSIPATLLLDTGAGGSLHLSRSFLAGRGAALDGRPSRTVPVEAVGGRGTVSVIPVETVTIGGRIIPCGEATVFDDTGPLSRYDGILGSDILSKFTLVIDYDMPGFHLVQAE